MSQTLRSRLKAAITSLERKYARSRACYIEEASSFRRKKTTPDVRRRETGLSLSSNERLLLQRDLVCAG